MLKIICRATTNFTVTVAAPIINTSFKYCIYGNKSMSSKKTKEEQVKHVNLGDMASKYQVFRNEDSEIIFDLYEERLKKHDGLSTEEQTEDPFTGINLQRGKTGVFDIEDLVNVLKRENSEDIFVASVPKEVNYVDYICVTNGKSQKHMKAIAQFVRRVYKKKRNKSSDYIPRLEGENCSDWMALDLGNIALHIFSREARTKYDLDSLWAIGPQYDVECNKQELETDSWSDYLKDLQPAS